MKKKLAALAVFFIVICCCGTKAHAEENEFWELVYLVHAEASNQDLTGKKLVADCVLNRVASSEFPDSIHEVIFQENQFSPIKDGGYEKAKSNWTEEDYIAVLEEWTDQVDYEVLYFCSNGYLPYGTPAYQYGSHFFCK